MTRHPTEDELQVYAADVIRAFGIPGIVSFHVPNGGKRPIGVAKKLKAMGTLAGVADWVFVLPGGKVAFLELKKHDGYQSHSQREFQRDVAALGAPYFVAKSLEEIDGILSGFGVINKSDSQPSGGAMGREGGPVMRAPLPKLSKVAA